MEIKDFVTAGNRVHFDSFRNDVFYYTIMHRTTLDAYQFQVPLEDVRGATLKAIDKSVTFMRWIRKSMGDKTFIKL